MILLGLSQETRKQILNYLFMPQIGNRLGNLFDSGFVNLAYTMAYIYRAAGILPTNHPYLMADSKQKIRLTSVIAEAANHLIINHKHIDKIIVFIAILAGLVMLALQFFILMASLLINPVMAAVAPADRNFFQSFITPNPNNDIALRLMDRVFGIPDLFETKETTGTIFHFALHNTFQFFSVGLLIVAGIIIVYFIFAIAAETAQTGTPFGKRYNQVWAPIRLVVAFGLLIPAGYGLNSAQYITLYAAKWGSGFATNGWIEFNDILAGGYNNGMRSVATPSVPEISHLPAFLMVARACKYAEKMLDPGIGEINAYLVKNPAEGEARNLDAAGASVSWEDALEYYNQGDIRIRFGERDDTEYTEYKGHVKPFCGEIILQTVNIGEPGARVIQAFYFDLIKRIWRGEGPYAGIDSAACNLAKKQLIPSRRHASYPCPGAGTPPLDPLPSPTEMKNIEDSAKEETRVALENAVTVQIENGRWEFDDRGYGWAGAGIWYNKFAQVNGSITGAALNAPRPVKYPDIMERTKKNEALTAEERALSERYRPVFCSHVTDRCNIADLLSEVRNHWESGGYKLGVGAAGGRVTGSAFVDAINAILGTQGLFDMCSNADTHPLAQLSAVGKGVVEASIQNLGSAVATGAVGGLARLFEPYTGAALNAASGFFMTVATVGLVIGFILFYVLPFMPFLYFFFAIGGWIKGIFEAMVGVPLWALAHIRIDGEGLPGDAAKDGYFLIFEITVRPILIVFGLLASILICTALIKILNEVFYLVVSNVAGFNPTNLCGAGGEGTPGDLSYFRGPVDEFFFTILYAIITYMICMSSFKLIDLIPNKILRWMGQTVPTFNDLQNETAEGLVQRLSIGGAFVSDNLSSAGRNIGSMFDSGLGVFGGRR